MPEKLQHLLVEFANIEKPLTSYRSSQIFRTFIHEFAGIAHIQENVLYIILKIRKEIENDIPCIFVLYHNLNHIFFDQQVVIMV